MRTMAVVGVALALAGCRADVKDPGKLPQVDVHDSGGTTQIDVKPGTVPDVDVRADSSVKLPDVHLPKVKAPDVKAPDIKLPHVKAPDLHLPGDSAHR